MAIGAKEDQGQAWRRYECRRGYRQRFDERVCDSLKDQRSYFACNNIQIRRSYPPQPHLEALAP